MNTKIKFYTDENIPFAVVAGLRRRDINVLTVPEAKRLGKTDEDHLAFAKKQHRVIFTHDDDFLKLHAKGIDHAGIVYVHQGKSIGYIVRGLHLIYQILSPDDMKNHIEFL